MAKRAKYDGIQPDRKNANKGTERGRYMVEASLRETGAGRSIVLDKDGRIIAGNKTFEAASDIGLPVRIVETDGRELVAVKRTDLDLSDDTGAARKLAYYDNRAGQVGLEWDAEVLLGDIGAGLDLSAMFRQDELDELLADLTPKPTGDTEAQTDRAEELRQAWGVESGQMWQLGEHRLICGDCTDAATVARVMGGERAGLLHADPPYGVDLLNKPGNLGKSKVYTPVEGDDKPFDPRPFLSLADVSIFWGANHFADRLPPSPFWLVWDKQGGAKDTTFATCELAWCSDKQPARIITHVWDGFRRDSEKGVERYHPTQKPIAVIEWALGWTNVDVVLEPFSGSGTTIIACENLARRCRACEISPAYVAVALQRFYDHCGKLPVLLEA